MLALSLVCLVTSCGTVPQQKYFQKGSLTNMRRVAVIVSSGDLQVRQSREGQMDAGQFSVGLLFGPLALIATEPIDWAIKSGADASQAQSLQATRPKKTIAQRLSEHFTKTLSDSRVFDSIQEIPADTKGGPLTESLSNQDALIRLRVTDVSLRPVTRDELSLYVEVSAEMVVLKNGKERRQLWSRQERTSSNEPHPLDFYKSQGVPMLDECLGKLANRLADDIIYAK